MKPLLVVGQTPGKTPPPGVPPFWDSHSIKALTRLAALDEWQKWYEFTEFTNMIPHAAGREVERNRPAQHQDAIVGAERIEQKIATGAWTHVVLLGGHVAQMLGMSLKPQFDWVPWNWREPEGTQVAWSPHPSGRCRTWNDPLRRAEGEVFWQDVVTTIRGKQVSP